MGINKKILVTGGSGMVGSALKKILPEAIYVSSKNFDLTSARHAYYMYKHHSPDYVIHLAAKVGGVKANSENLADFFASNVRINTNVLDYAKMFRVKKVVSLLSTCVYPDDVTYPLTEDQFHNGEPHPSNYGYAYAKRMLEVHSRALRDQYGCNFICAIPNNLYGENDAYDLEDSHVIPAITRKIWEAKQTGSKVVLWGDGSPLREFTYSEDLARTLLFLLENYDEKEPINVGNTQEFSIRQLAETVADILDYQGEIIWDTSKPAGQYKKPSDNSKLIELGWETSNFTTLKEGLKKTCEWFTMNYPNVRGVS